MRTSAYRWKITRDRISEGADNGTEGPHNADPTLNTNATRFSLWDDDGVCCYEGYLYGDFSGFEPLDDFGGPNVGCSSVKLAGEWL